jgi:trans-AT polyketide synthase/acyltransferase/oxidoreductase domain-containing protein
VTGDELPDAVVFPGQGSQRQGMGADLHQRYAAAALVFEEASDAAGADLCQICFADDERLHQTEFTQPCILTLQIAAFRVAVEEFGLAPGLFGGHSLGEYTALVAAGALPLADAVRLVRARGALMQRAVPAGHGAMAALLLDDIEASPALRLSVAAGAEVANHNSPAQAVISGTTENLARAKAALADALPDLTFVSLRVSAPFHCSLMRPAVAEFAALLESCAPGMIAARAGAVTSNYTGGFHVPEALVGNLVAQMSSPVRWHDNMCAIGARAGRIYEIGPRAALTKFFQLIGWSVIPITTAGELRGILGRHRPAPHPDGARPAPHPHPAPVLTPAELGDPGFLLAHGTRLAYVAGGMRMGISSPELVIRLARAGVLAFLGIAGLPQERAEQDIRRVRAELPSGTPWGVNLSSDPHDPAGTSRTVELLLRLGVPCIELGGFAGVDADLVRCRISGLRSGPDGRPQHARRLLAKVRGLDAARQFLMPPPETIVRQLRERGLITDEESALAARVSMADDICAETSEGALTLLPAILRLRDAQHRSAVRVGLGGGLGTPQAVAAAFAMGADFVLTGSVNQCTPQAGTSALAKDMLAAADIEDFGTAPDADMFELGGRVWVLRRGVLFPARGDKLYETYVRQADFPAPQEAPWLEARYLRKSVTEVWAELTRWDRAQAEQAVHDGRRRMALVFRWYLTDSLRRAQAGQAADRLNFQIRSSPALGAFNLAVRGTALAHWRNRNADEVAWFLMSGAAAILGARRPAVSEQSRREYAWSAPG